MELANAPRFGPSLLSQQAEKKKISSVMKRATDVNLEERDENANYNMCVAASQLQMLLQNHCPLKQSVARTYAQASR
jgi:hypothetical protein